MLVVKAVMLFFIIAFTTTESIHVEISIQVLTIEEANRMKSHGKKMIT